MLGRQRDLAERSNQTYAIIWDKCYPTMKGKLEQLADCHFINVDKNSVQLLQEIRNVISGREAHKQPIYAMAQLIIMLTCLVHGQSKSNEDYKEAFEPLWDTTPQQGGSLVNHPGLINDRAVKIAIENGRANDMPTQDDTERARFEISAKIKAAFMLSGSNNARY